MRVIAGTARGIRLEVPKGLQIRPTLDRVREALFSILSPRLPECRFLDLFAGTGANGIEALSRGAAWATFIDQAPAALACIARNLEKARLTAQARVLRMPLPAGLTAFAQRETPYPAFFTASASRVTSANTDTLSVGGATNTPSLRAKRSNLSRQSQERYFQGHGRLLRFARNDGVKDAGYDIVFADPPYAFPDYAALLDQISARQLLAAGGLLILEHATGADLGVCPVPLSRTRQAVYGDTTLSFFA